MTRLASVITLGVGDFGLVRFMFAVCCLVYMCHDCHSDGAGELFIWSVLYFIEYETNDLTMALFNKTQVSDGYCSRAIRIAKLNPAEHTKCL